MKIELLHHMGDDLMVVNAARVSFDKHHDEFDTRDDTKLIRYLARNNHWTPFGHPQAQFRVTVPVFVARQWHRHTVGHVMNEVSRRYVDSEPEFFMPDRWRGRPTGGAKQGSSGELDAQTAAEVTQWYETIHLKAESTYRLMLSKGVAPEQARMVLPQTMYTSWIDTGSLAFWARFCKLRLDSHAQEEIRDCASLIGSSMRALFPVSWAALMEYA